jgi:hypothetical protein
VVGIQCHPEELADKERWARLLFEGLVKAGAEELERAEISGVSPDHGQLRDGRYQPVVATPASGDGSESNLSRAWAGVSQPRVWRGRWFISQDT